MSLRVPYAVRYPGLPGSNGSTVPVLPVPVLYGRKSVTRTVHCTVHMYSFIDSTVYTCTTCRLVLYTPGILTDQDSWVLFFCRGGTVAATRTGRWEGGLSFPTDDGRWGGWVDRTAPVDPVGA